MVNYLDNVALWLEFQWALITAQSTLPRLTDIPPRHLVLPTWNGYMVCLDGEHRSPTMCSAAFTAFEGFRNLRLQDQKAWGTLSGPLPQNYAVKVLEQFKTNLNSLEM